jgi:fibronectin-binding autotransporter adhesin
MRGNSSLETAGRLRWQRVAVLVLASAAVVGGPSAAQAATWWRNTTTTGLWSDTALWSNAASGGTTGGPVNDTTTDVVVFNQTAVTGNTVVTLDAATSITGITVGNSGLTTLRSSDATARTLSIGSSGITANAGSGGFTIGTSGSLVGVAITANQTWTNNAASPITVAGNLSGSATLTKAGTGTLAFSGASTHSGTFTINAGTVQLGNTGTSSLSRVVMANTAGATLQLTGSAATLRSISGGGASGGNVDLGSAMLTLQNNVGTDYGGVMSGSGGVIKAGGVAGFTFTAQQTYTGPTVVLANWLVTGTDNAIASTAYVQTDGGILDISNRPQTIGGLTGLSGGVHSFTGAGGTGGSLTLNVASGTSYTYAGNIGSTLAGFPLIKAGGGTQILTASNSYTGGTTITGGTLQLNRGASIIGGIVNNATLTLNGVLNTDFLIGNNISGTGGLSKSSGGSATLTGTNTYSGTTTITGGFLVAGSTTGLSASSVVVTAGGILDISQRAVTIGGLSGTTDSVHSFSGATTGSMTLAVASGTLTYGGQVGGSYPNLALTKTSPGTQVLTGNNTYTGLTAVSGGWLVLGHANALGSTAQGTTVANGGSLGVQGGITVAESLSISGTGFGGDGALVNISGNNTFSGTVTLGSDARVGALDGALTLSAPVGGGFGLTKVGPGTVILSASNGYTGGTTITGGTLQINQTGVIGGGAVVNNATLALNYTNSVVNVFFSNNISGTGGLIKSSGGNAYLTGTNTYSGTTTITGGFLVAGSTTGLSASSVVVTAGGILDIAQRAVTIGGLSGSTDSVHSFPGTGGQGALTLAVASGTVTYGGQVGGSFPNLRLTKTGLGTQILSGSNNYSGNTAVDVGTLLVNGAVGSGTVTVASAAILGGSGTIGGPVAVLGGGILSPGTSPGTLTVNNSLTLANTSILEFELNPANFTIGGGVNDLITGVTALALDGVLNVSGAGDWTTVPNNSSWRLFNYSGALTNNVLSFGSMPTLATGQSFQINTATPGQVDLVIVPEPGALALAAAGVGLAATWALRRRSK